MPSTYQLNAPDVTFESFDREVLLINLRNGNYYSLRGTGPAIWLLAIHGRNAAEIAAELSVQCRIDATAATTATEGLLGQLVAEILLVPATSPSPAANSHPMVTWPAAYEPPVFDRYTDMQQLLLVDPIHEVDQSGWPKTPEPDRR